MERRRGGKERGVEKGEGKRIVKKKRSREKEREEGEKEVELGRQREEESRHRNDKSRPSEKRRTRRCCWKAPTVTDSRRGRGNDRGGRRRRRREARRKGENGRMRNG